jgi:hypothetical protein
MSGAYFALSLNPREKSCRPRFRSWSDRSSITCGRLGAAIPLPKRISPPVTEVGSSGLTKLLISRENELGLRGSPRGGPSEGRAGNQRDRRESSDKRLHDTSPCLDHRPRFVHERRGRSAGRPLPSDTRSGKTESIPGPLISDVPSCGDCLRMAAGRPQTAPRTAEQQAQPSAQAIEASVMIRLMARAQRPQRMPQPRQP